MPSHSSHYPQEVLPVQFNLHVHTGGPKPHSFHFIFVYRCLSDTLRHHVDVCGPAGVLHRAVSGPVLSLGPRHGVGGITHLQR